MLPVSIACDRTPLLLTGRKTPSGSFNVAFDHYHGHSGSIKYCNTTLDNALSS